MYQCITFSSQTNSHSTRLREIWKIGREFPKNSYRPFEGKWFNSLFDHPVHLEEHGISYLHYAKSTLKLCMCSPFVTVSRRRSCAQTERRRRQVIDGFLDHFPSRYSTRDGLSPRVYEHVMRTCQDRILEIVAPHLVSFASTVITTPPLSYSSDGTSRQRFNFPRLKELNVISIHMDWLAVSPLLRHMTMHDRHSSTGGSIAYCPITEETSLTHVAFNLPSTAYSAEFWANRSAEEHFKILGIGAPMRVRSSRPTKAHHLPHSVKHIMLRVTPLHCQDQGLKNMMRRVRQLTQDDERVYFMVAPTSPVDLEQFWLGRIQGGEQGWEE